MGIMTREWIPPVTELSNTLDRNEIALRIFCATMSRPDAKIDLYPELGEKQIRVCFAMADTFQNVADESRKPDHG